MKCLASLVVCATLSQVLWIGLSGGQDIDGETTEAPTPEEKGGSDVTTTAKPDGETTEAPTPEEKDGETTEAPTPEEKVDCSTYTSRKECCAAGNSTACVFFHCTDEDNDVISKECIAANATRSCSDEYTPGENLCKAEETPEGGSDVTTTAKPGEGEKTTEVDCAASNSDENACCTVGNSTACKFFRCTSADGNVTGTLCVAAASTPACPEQTDTPSANICEESGEPTTAGPENQNATKSPTTGEEAGGQQFDAASFIGGIVLCAGILAIGYFGLKFYRSRQERNYESM